MTRAPRPATTGRGSPPATPRWVKVFGILVAIPILLFLVVLLAHGPGGHDPGRHFGSSAGGHVPPQGAP